MLACVPHLHVLVDTALLTRVQDMCAPRYTGSVDCLWHVYSERGLRGLTAGFIPRYMRMSAWQLAFWLTYERGLLE